MFFHEVGDKITGTGILMRFVEFFDIGPDKFDYAFMIPQQVFNQVLTGILP